MKLSDIEVFVGVVILIKDPLNLGRIKVSSPGYFNTDTMDIDDIFWISPLTINYQNYSQLNIGNKVWVFHNLNNYLEYWYLPFFELNPNTQSLMNEGNDVDIQISRMTGSGSSMQLYYDTKDGIQMNHTGSDETHKVQIDPAGNINVIGNKNINILTKGKNGITTIGEETNGHERTVNGETMFKAMTDLTNILYKLSTVLSANPWTCDAGASLFSDITEWKTKYNETNTLSSSVNICK